MCSWVKQVMVPQSVNIAALCQQINPLILLQMLTFCLSSQLHSRKQKCLQWPSPHSGCPTACCSRGECERRGLSIILSVLVFILMQSTFWNSPLAKPRPPLSYCCSYCKAFTPVMASFQLHQQVSVPKEMMSNFWKTRSTVLERESTMSVICWSTLCVKRPFEREGASIGQLHVSPVHTRDRHVVEQCVVLRVEFNIQASDAGTPVTQLTC